MCSDFHSLKFQQDAIIKHNLKMLKTKRRTTIRRSASLSARTDVFTPAKRSEVMSHIRGKNSKPELLVRKGLLQLGHRYRLHRSDLPGTPDVYIPALQTAVFVNGCFWHLHPRCKQGRFPKSNVEFWHSKLSGNRRRDHSNYRKLRKLGKRVLVIRECDIQRHVLDLPEYLADMLRK